MNEETMPPETTGMTVNRTVLLLEPSFVFESK